jgi:PAS domain S-box-containing protein
MLEYLLKEASSLNEFIILLTAISGGGLWVVRMLMTGRKRFEAMQSSVNEIVKQLTPNGGTSMFDMVKQAHKLSIENAGVVSQMMEAVDRIKAYQWNFAETLTDKPIWECDPSGSYIRINTAFAKLSERTVAELTGAGWENFIHPEDRARVYEEWHDAVTRKRIFEGHFKVKSRSGKTYSVKALAMPVMTESGGVTSFIGRYDEVTPLP